MVSYSSEKSGQYSSGMGRCGYGSSSGEYSVKVKPICCGAVNRGQRCTGCPG